jgi:8-oxo-dGTP pyrophosphatase MutT (NUDIX family)
MPLIRGVIVYVLNEAGEILFLRRSGSTYGGSWWPVAGTPKPDEPPLRTAARELEEETGINARHFYELGIPIPHRDGCSVLMAYVIYVSAGTRITLNYEHDDWRWSSPEQALASVPVSSRKYIQHLTDNFVASRPDENSTHTVPGP